MGTQGIEKVMQVFKYKRYVFDSPGVLRWPLYKNISKLQNMQL